MDTNIVLVMVSFLGVFVSALWAGLNSEKTLSSTVLFVVSLAFICLGGHGLAKLNLAHQEKSQQGQVVTDEEIGKFADRITKENPLVANAINTALGAKFEGKESEARLGFMLYSFAADRLKKLTDNGNKGKF